jgi:hypothetical protein
MVTDLAEGVGVGISFEVGCLSNPVGWCVGGAVVCDAAVSFGCSAKIGRIMKDAAAIAKRACKDGLREEDLDFATAH